MSVVSTVPKGIQSKKELIIMGHPDEESFCSALLESYVRGAREAGKTVSVLKLREMNFRSNLEFGYRKRVELEDDLQDARRKIEEADHLVWIFPVWWATMPALMKGFVDRVFLPGWAFSRGTGLPEKLLKGKTASLLVTMDSPVWYHNILLRNPVKNVFARATLGFCGIKTRRIDYFTPLKQSTVEKRERWKEKAFRLGNKI